MSTVEALILGIVQGLTEFLPVSSSGHLILVPWLFNWEEPGLAFDAAIHLGTLVAVVIYFWRDLLAMLKAVPYGITHLGSLFRSDPAITEFDPARSDARLAILLIIGSIPAGVIGLLGNDRIESFFHVAANQDTAIAIISVMLIVFGLVMYAADRRARLVRTIREVGIKDALIIGGSQAIALIPGVSRSGVTLSSGLFLGLKREDAARFSFLLGFPLILLAGITGMADLIQSSPSHSDWAAIVVGMVASAVTGLFAVSFMLKYLQTASTKIFVIYRILLGTATLLLLASGFR